MLLSLTLPALADVRDYDGGTAEGSQMFRERTYLEYFGTEPCKLQVAEDIPFPFGRFEVMGRFLRPRVIATPEFPLPATAFHLRPTNSFTPFDEVTFDDQMLFLKEGVGWSRLSLVDAKHLWGKPRVHSDYYSFDARNSHHGEENIFHIDLSFDDKSFVKSYRVRGIQISDPKWIGRAKNPKFPEGPDVPTVIADSESLLDRRALIPIKCGIKETILDLSISKGEGLVEVDPLVHVAKAKESGPWFQTNCVLARDEAEGTRTYRRPTRADVQRWWGMPHTVNGISFTYDTHCVNNKEPEIYHIDLEFDDKSNVKSSRLRGPGIGSMGNGDRYGRYWR